MTLDPNDVLLEGEDAGQSEPLVSRLRLLIHDYPAGAGIVKELLQNADDAGASWEGTHWLSAYWKVWPIADENRLARAQTKSVAGAPTVAHSTVRSTGLASEGYAF